MLKSSANFNDEEKLLIRDLFGNKPGDVGANNSSVEVGEQMNSLKHENDKLYFELR
jgi:hypothetical protein